MSPNGSPAEVVLYTNRLFAPSETFVTTLVTEILKAKPHAMIATHEVEGGSASLPNVTVIPRYFRRYSAGFFINGCLRRVCGRELFELPLRRLLARVPSGAVHAHFGQMGYYAFRALRGERHGIPRLIVNFYGYDASGLLVDDPSWHGKYLEMFSYPRLRVIVEGPRMKDRLVALGCAANAVSIMPLCLDLSRVQTAMQSRRPPTPPVVVFGLVGRLVEKKGILFALTVLAPLLRADANVRFVVVGDGPQRTAVEDAVDRLGVRGQVRLRGFLSHDAMLASMAQWSALLVPSLTAGNGDSEGGAPTVVSEAQLSGVPVIASDHADIPSALTDHTYLFKEGDGASCAGAVSRFIQTRGAEYDVEAARGMALRRHDAKAIIRQYLTLYADETAA